MSARAILIRIHPPGSIYASVRKNWQLLKSNLQNRECNKETVMLCALIQSHRVGRTISCYCHQGSHATFFVTRKPHF